MPTDIKTKFDKQAFEGPYEYICINKPTWLIKDDDGEHDEEEEESDDESEKENSEPKAKRQKTNAKAPKANKKDKKKPNPDQGKNMSDLPATDYPTYKWVMMRSSYDLLDDNCKEVLQRNPDYYDMHVYTDYYAYGVLDLVEKLCHAALPALRTQNLHKLWSIVSILGHFLNHGLHDNAWWGADDGPRCPELNHVIGRLVLSTLDAVQRVAELHEYSKFRDLGLVMALFAEYSLGSPDFGLETGLERVRVNEEGYEVEEEVDWHETVVAYAKRAGIDLKGVGIDGKIVRTGVEVDAFVGEEEDGGTDWECETAMTAYFGTHTMSKPFWGGRHWNITKWTRAERKKFSFDKQDPLKDFPASVLREGNVVPG